MTVNHDIAGSSPAGGAKKSCTKVRDFFIHCGAMAYHRRRRISSRDSVYLITEGAFLLRNDDIQRQAVDDIRCVASMIYTAMP